MGLVVDRVGLAGRSSKCEDLACSWEDGRDDVVGAGSTEGAS